MPDPSAVPILDHAIIDTFVRDVGLRSTKELLALFLREAEDSLDALRRLACDEQDAIRHHAHTLGGSGGMFGLTRLSAMLRQLQHDAPRQGREEYRLAVAAIAEVLAISCAALGDELRRRE